MNRFGKPQSSSFGWLLLAMVFFSRLVWAQDSELESLKKQLKDIQTQMQRMMERIEQLEKEKATEAARVGSTEPSQLDIAAKPNAVTGISSAFNPAISVNGLFLGGFSSSPKTTNRLTGLDFHNGLNLQEAEFQFTADVDPYWKANFILSVSQEGKAEVEEGYVTSEELPYDLLPRNTTLKLGKFFSAFGKHNLFHSHQFPFIEPPLINASVFGSEGLKEPGLGVSYLPPTSWFSELTLQGFAGENEALFRSNGDAKRQGAYLGHWKNFFDLSDSTTLEVGNSYIRGRNSSHGMSQAVGLDLTLKWRPLQMATEQGLIWQSEYIHFARDQARDRATRGGGLYSSLQYQFARRWWLQGRYDLLGIPRLDDDRKQRWSALLAFVPSEFSAIRLEPSYTLQERGKPVNQLLLQFNYTIGSHPAHQY